MKNWLNIENHIEESERENFYRKLISEDVRRGKLLAVMLIGFELILCLADISSSLLKVDDRFRFSQYLMMYLLMILINGIYLLAIRRFEEKGTASVEKFKKFRTGIILYITVIMSWGSAVSLIDQKLYGSLTVFMVNMIICSVIYYLDNKMILVPYSVASLILLIGLPFFQPSSDILIGHYVNLAVFVVISWFASRIIYSGYCIDFNSEVELKKANLLLEKEIEENKRINGMLMKANLQLKEAALIDELTGVPNRRSFRNFIEIALEKYLVKEASISVFMMDIDFFKQYNDNYGHGKGDQVLVAVAGTINSFVNRPLEFFGRWGGEEFIYVSLDADEEEVKKAADRLRQKINDLKIPHEYSESKYISVSIGICTDKISGRKDISRVIGLADEALYMATNSGRNCVRNVNEDTDEI